MEQQRPAAGEGRLGRGGSRRLNPSDRFVARHEAGHAVAAFHLGRDIVRVSIESDEETLGRIVMRSSRERLRCLEAGVLESDLRHDVENDVITLLAGGLVSGSTEGCAHDHGIASELVLAMSGSIAEAEAYAEWLRQRTMALLDSPSWNAGLLALTTVLLRRRTLSGSEVQVVIRQALVESFAWGLR